MSWKIVFAAIWVSCVILGIILTACIESRRKVEHVFDLAFGSVLCGESNIDTCGVSLTKCHDGMEYKCMINVRQRGD